MKKILLSTAALLLLSGASAFASDVSVGINLGGPAIIAAPAPVVIAQPVIVEREPVFIERPGYDPTHRDHQYWAARERHERWVREHKAHEHDHYDHYDDHR